MPATAFRARSSEGDLTSNVNLSRPNAEIGQSASSIRWIIACYIFAAAVLMPFASHPTPVMPALTPFVAAGITATDISTSFLLYVWFRDTRTWSLLVLGCAYLYSGVMSLLLLLTFPGAILPDQSILGSQQSAPLAFLLWTNGFAAIALASTIIEAAAPRQRCPELQATRAVRIGVGLTAAAAGGCAVASIALINDMPLLIAGSSFTPFNQAMNAAGLMLTVAAIGVILVFIHGTNAIYLCLSLALTAMLFANILGFAGGARYTLGWSLARLSWLLSACILFLFFMGQFARQQRLLVRTRDSLEQSVFQRTADLEKTVRQRDLLLREVYHRVKNNLQVVDSLLAMERRRLQDPTARNALDELRNRVFTLGLVHQQMMSSDNMETFSIAPFLQELTENLMASFGTTAGGIACSVAADPVPVNLDFAIPLGLLTTELLTNVIKHANATVVRIEFSRRGERGAILIVDDNGHNFLPNDGAGSLSTGAGNKIIDGITRQLEGEMRVVHQAGIRVEISMPLPEAA